MANRIPCRWNSTNKKKRETVEHILKCHISNFLSSWMVLPAEWFFLWFAEVQFEPNEQEIAPRVDETVYCRKNISPRNVFWNFDQQFTWFLNQAFRRGTEKPIRGTCFLVFEQLHSEGCFGNSFLVLDAEQKKQCVLQHRPPRNRELQDLACTPTWSFQCKVLG